MIRSRLFRVAAIAAFAVASVSVSAAMTPQTAPPPPSSPEPTRPTRTNPPPPAPVSDDLVREVIDQFDREFVSGRSWRHVLRVGQGYTLRAGESVRDVTVVFGNARIEGRVEGDLVVVMGSARLASTAVIEGSFVVVGGEADVDHGALVRNDVVTFGADIGFPDDFIFAGEHIVIGTGILGDWMRSVLPWVTGGLIWGRPIVPSLGWVWSIVGFFFVVYLVVNLLLHEPVRATTAELSRRPFGTFLAGLLMLLLWAPISALLAVTLVGLVVVPFFLCALIVAAMVGRVAVMRWIGESLIAPHDSSNRLIALRSFVVGFALLTLVYMVPVLGFVAWGLVGVFGLGAAVLAFLSAWRKETPRPTPPAQPHPASPDEHGALQFSAPYVPTPPTPPTPSAPSAPPAPPPPPASSYPLLRATFLERAAALGLDVMLVAIAHEGLRGTVFPRYSEFFFPLLLIYFIAFWTWKGTTVGGIIMKLRIVKVNGAPFESADAIVRALAGVLSFVALGIGVLWILRSDDLAPDGQPARQGWHDKAVGTWVIKDQAPLTPTI